MKEEQIIEINYMLYVTTRLNNIGFKTKEIFEGEYINSKITKNPYIIFEYDEIKFQKMLTLIGYIDEKGWLLIDKKENNTYIITLDNNEISDFHEPFIYGLYLINKLEEICYLFE